MYKNNSYFLIILTHDHGMHTQTLFFIVILVFVEKDIIITSILKLIFYTCVHVLLVVTSLPLKKQVQIYTRIESRAGR